MTAAQVRAARPEFGPQNFLEPDGTILGFRRYFGRAEQNRFQFLAPQAWRLISNLADALFRQVASRLEIRPTLAGE
jgi:hypothetical protein